MVKKFFVPRCVLNAFFIGAVMLSLFILGQGCIFQSSGGELVEKHCTECHGLLPIKSSRKTGREWRITVSRMMEYGLHLNKWETRKAIDYLSRTYGPDSP